MRGAWTAAMASAAALGLGSASSSATAPAIASGMYDNTLILAVAPDGRFTGHFDMRDPGPPVERDCIVDFQGKLAGNSGTITAYDSVDDRRINGRISSTGPGKVRISLPDEPDGCGNTWSFANKDDPADFALQHREPWIAVREVKAAKAYFSPAPGAPHGRAYVVQFDAVAVRAEKGGWAQVDYVDGERDSSGWLKESDLYPAPW